MFPRADLSSTRPVASIEAPTPVAGSTDLRQEVFHRLTQIAIGKQLQVDVLELLDDGAYLVKVADTTARMNLPVGTRVGESIPMTLIAKEPRPTFLLPSQTGNPSATASLSTTGRLIDHILHAAQDQEAPALLIGKTPLIASSGALPDTRQVATALQNTVTLSGLFYESHVQEWSNGARPLTALLKEPQAGFESTLPRALPQDSGNTSPSTSASHTSLAQLVSHLKEPGSSVQSLLHLIEEAQQQALAGPPTDALAIKQANTLPDIAPEAARLINLQLNTLEQPQIHWQGELWPGQRMEWDISEDFPEGPQGEQQQPIWTSVVRFALPTLGAISATIRLTGERVHIQISAPSDDAVASLREHCADLSQAMEAAGSPLDSLTVKRDESA